MEIESSKIGYNIDFENNRIILKKNGDEIQLNSKQIIRNLSIMIQGTGNEIIIEEPIVFKKSIIRIVGNNNYISINSTNKELAFNINMPANGGIPTTGRRIVIGKDCYMGGVYLYCSDENDKIEIGNRCFLSDNVTVRTGDGHTIYNCNDYSPISASGGNIFIDEHVWIGSGACIFKNVRLNKHIIIGAGSIVTRACKESNVILAGNPARIIRVGCNWNYVNTQAYRRNIEKKEEYKEWFDEIRADNLPYMKKFIAIIPSRYASSRFPGKPLAKILEKPMIQWVYERVAGIKEISEVYVATDDERIFNAVMEFGGKAIMTGECACGSDRVYQACEKIEADIILNIQGDEPMIKAEMIKDLISAFDDSEVEMATLKKEIISESDINNPNIAKLITDQNGDAIYFSRSTIPYNRDGRDDVKYYKHIGVYGYTKEFLKTFVSLPQSDLEKAEQLEQLRAIDNGYKIRVVETEHQSIGVDLPEHIAIVEEELRKEGLA